MTRALLIVMALASPAFAHKPSDAQLALAVDHDRVTGRIEIAVRDLDPALALDRDGNGDITWGEVEDAAPRIAAYVSDRLAISSSESESPCPLALGDAALADHFDGAYVVLPVTASCPQAPHDLVIHYRLLFDLDAQHRGLVHIAGQTLIVRDDQPVHAHLGDGTHVLSFVREGVWHIWLGLDHILFLLCLIVPAVRAEPDPLHLGPAARAKRSKREIFEIVTAFTLAHSITLVISAVGFITLPSRFIETAIALSVVAAAVNNLVRAVDARWAVAFALGLLHGFGFSAVLIDLGLPSRELICALLGFNVGVELGQAAIVLAVLPLVYAIRKQVAYRAFVLAGSGAVALVASVWTVQRALA